MPDTDGTGSGDEMAGGKKRSPWMTHVKKTMRANRGMKLGQVLKLASKTFKKSRRGGAALSPHPYGGQEGGAAPLTPASVGGRRRRGSRKSRKSRSRKH
jgi:hypothetical protein